MNRQSVLPFACGVAIAVVSMVGWQARSPQPKEPSTPVASAPIEDRAPAPSVAPAPKVPDSWLERAQRITMPGRREYALPLNNPDTVPANSATHMEANDLVVGITHHGHSRAYPWWILSNFHVVNDTIVTNTEGKVPVYIGLCEQCSGAAAFDPMIEELPDRPLIFQVSGIAAGTIEISDVQTVSQWHPFSGEAVSGPLKGRQLKPIPYVMERWDVWKEKHPDSDVVLGSLQMRRRPHGMSHGALIGHPYLPDFFAKVSNLNDSRLPRSELVYGMKVGEEGAPIAVRLRDLKKNGFLELEHKGTPILLKLVGEFAVRAFIREHEGSTLNFQPDYDNALFLRDQSGSVWNELGEAIGGREALKKTRLRLARGYLTEWYEWVSNAPQSDLHNPVGKPNVPLPNITISDEKGRAFPLSSLKGGHTVLIFGCATSPLLEANKAELEALYRDYQSKGVKFYFVYKTLANPGLGGFVSPYMMKERLVQVRQARLGLGTSIPWLCDTFGNEFLSAVSAKANTELIVDPSGKIIQARDWVDVGALRSDLATFVGSVENSINPAALSLKGQRPPPSARRHVLPVLEVPHGLTPVMIAPQRSDRPYIAKLRAEADRNLIKDGKGKLYLGFHLDPIYAGYWNNERSPLRVDVRGNHGEIATPSTITATKGDQPKDIDPREFLIDIEGVTAETELQVKVNYVVCNDTVPFEEDVTQTYLVRLAPDPFENPRTVRLAPQYRQGDIVLKFLENDKDNSGDLSGEEIPSGLSGADGNKDGRVDAGEMKQVEAQLLKQQDYRW